MTDLNKINDFRVIVYGDTKVNSIVPKSGVNAGKNIDVLTLEVYKPKAEKQPDGSWKKLDSEFYKIELYSQYASTVASMITSGIALRVSGTIKESEYTNKEGEKKTSKTIVADSLAVDLLQKGLKEIKFEKITK